MCECGAWWCVVCEFALYAVRGAVCALFVVRGKRVVSKRVRVCVL